MRRAAYIRRPVGFRRVGPSPLGRLLRWFAVVVTAPIWLSGLCFLASNPIFWIVIILWACVRGQATHHRRELRHYDEMEGFAREAIDALRELHRDRHGNSAITG